MSFWISKDFKFAFCGISLAMAASLESFDAVKLNKLIKRPFSPGFVDHNHLEKQARLLQEIGQFLQYCKHNIDAVQGHH